MMAGTLSGSPLSLAQGMRFLIKVNKQMKQKILTTWYSQESRQGKVYSYSVSRPGLGSQRILAILLTIEIGELWRRNVRRNQA